MSYSESIHLGLSHVIQQAFRSQDSAAYTRQVAKGEAIYYCGDRPTAIYHLESGRVRLTRHTADGKLITFRTVASGELFGETDLYLPVHECEATAEVDSRIMAYSSAQVMFWVSRDAGLAVALMQQAHLLLQQLKRRLLLLTIQSIRERTLAYLREQAVTDSNGNQQVALNKPLKAVAEELNISAEAFYRVLARLEADGVIARSKQRITLLQDG
ncbi:MAG: Crp/Fnr family transcriptional regulator [Cyanobacteria bacterium P01_A01_bin.135]